MRVSLFFTFLLFILLSCKKEEQPMFQLLNAEQTGIDFVNHIEPTKDLNIFTYLYFYNGGGVAAGDLNNDGLIDLIFTSNLGLNKLYLNEGSMHFKEVGSEANFDTKGGWSNGISIVDINDDGILDFYISQVGEYDNITGVNQLFVCQEIKNGIPVYKEMAANYGLNLKGFGTQAAFVDFDLDGDLDFFQLNHSVHRNGTFGERRIFLNTFHPLSGDRYFENVDGYYIDKTKESGINSNALGYGLGLAIGDINLDGKPDLYVGNDFHENDYLYINQGNGLFEDKLDKFMTHTSRFSMGVDIADFNNDIFPDLVSLDMLPSEYKLVKMADGEDVFYNFNFKLKQGYNFQFSRNALQVNNGNNTFSEIAMFSGVHATDWSWSSLFTDFDNDGLKDLFVSNGINKRMNDTDYMNYVSNDAIQQKINNHEFDESDELLTDLLPEVKIPNKFFHNKGNANFDEVNAFIKGNRNSFSNGAIYADLDNDGDLDIVTNNINDPAFVYENLSEGNASLKVDLKGKKGNREAIGSKILIYQDGKTQYLEKYPVRGFQSSALTPLHFGLGENTKIDSMTIIWPDNTFETVATPTLDSTMRIRLVHKAGLPLFDYQSLEKKYSQSYQFEDIAAVIGLDIKHAENDFNEFDREALIPAMQSTPGPAIAVADINQDGLDDVFFGSSKWTKPQVMVQRPDGGFVKMNQPFLEADSTYEESAATWADINADGFIDLLIADGGNEYYGKTPYLKPRVYLNDQTGILKPKVDAFPDIFETQSCIETSDVDNDGDLDVFIGGKTIAWQYGNLPNSYLLINNGKGKFSDQTPKELKELGMVKAAKWVDIDADGDQDLILACQWDGIFCFENVNGKLTKRILSDKKGWWNNLYPSDIDGDGDIDFILGNLGLNSRIKGTEKEPIRMYVSDIDDNGRLDQIVTHYMAGEEVIFADKKELEKQMPFIRKKFNLSRDFADANFKDVFGKDKINSARVFEANFLENAVLINKGDWRFELKALPEIAQYSPVLAVSGVEKTNHDYLLMGNFFESNIQLGRYDAGFGGLVHFGSDSWDYSAIPKLQIRGQVRHIVPIKIKGSTHYLVARNDDVLMVLRKSSE